MGQRYESKKKSVSENREASETNAENRETLKNEYAFMSELTSMIGELEDESAEAVIAVENVGEQKNAELQEEHKEIEEQKEELSEEITDELDKLNDGLRKMERLGRFEFGKGSVSDARSDYKKQIDKYKDLLGDLGESVSDVGAGLGDQSGSEGGMRDFREYQEEPQILQEGEPVYISHSNLSPNNMYANGSNTYTNIVDSLNTSSVEYKEIQPYRGERTEADIIKRVSGGDMTAGSCSSLALAYAGNKAGYDVLDFRDGASRDFFSSRSSIEQVASLPGVNSTILNGRNDIATANQLLNMMVPGKEYYLATGQHASIVRKNGDYFEYLELQHPSYGNGWHDLDDYILEHRFGARSLHMATYSNYLIEVDSLSNNREFLSVLGYINTAESDQRKGGAGNVR